MTRIRNILFAFGAALALALPAAAQVSQAEIKGFVGPKHTASELNKFIAAAKGKGTPAPPCACLKEYVDWCKQSDSKKCYYLLYTLTQINNNMLVGYTEGSLGYNGTTGNMECGSTVGWPWYINQYKDASGQPFNRPATQKAIVDVRTGSCTASIKVGANPWMITPPLQCNNQIYTAADPSRGCLYVMTFKKVVVDVLY